jgi:cbb3-type cytochrome oxidase subunit 3
MIYNLVHSILREAQNINAYGLFSFVLFFGFFIGVLVWALALKKNHLDQMSALPLDAEEKPSTDKIQS